MIKWRRAEREYLASVAADHDRRIRWWRAARFGMFLHWGLYARLGRQEWVMNRERIPVREYEKLAADWKPKPRPAREWARLARAAGMRYLVLTAKHHEGFLLWDSRMSDFNAARRGPGRDLVREYVEACREFGLKIGLYYSLMDWHHRDGLRCLHDERARRRFLDYTQGCVRELCSNYGRIDILWYDVAWPLRSPRMWRSRAMNAMVRQLQPHILINGRAQLPEDFSTPENEIKPEKHDWETCMRLNGAWGWEAALREDWLPVRAVLNMLRTCAANRGNLLLNVGPRPDGSLPAEAWKRLTAVGRWLKNNGEAVYGPVDTVEKMEWMTTGAWTRKGRTAYFWITRGWPGRELAFGGLQSKLRRARLLPRGQWLPFRQAGNRLVIRGLPRKCPDRIAGLAILQMDFQSQPRQKLGPGCVLLAP